jgi:Fe-S-cluster containining protein
MQNFLGNVWIALQRLFFPRKNKSQEVLRIYAEVDQAIECFQKNTSLRCVAGCGRCCENPQIEITPLEVFPLADELWRKKEAVSWLERIEHNPNQKQCVFYQPNLLSQGQGRCGIYPLRPLICRLFGFAAKADKQGNAQLVTCLTIKESQEKTYLKTLQQINNGLSVPWMADYARRIQSIDPGWAQKQVPINEAIRLALERVGLELSCRRKVL